MHDMMRKKSTDSYYNYYKITDLTSNPEEDTNNNNLMVCTHCEVNMTEGKYRYWCKQCGLVIDKANDNTTSKTTTTTTKKIETTGPRIAKPGDNTNILFKNIKVDTQTSGKGKDKHKPFNIDEGDDEMYKGMGFDIVKTRITLGGKILRYE